MIITAAEAALLGLLNESPKHPYQIEKDVQMRNMRFWTELSMSSIYKLLRHLEELEFVTSQTDMTEENRVRKTYTITESGLAALKEKLAELLREPEYVRWSVDVALCNLDVFERNVQLAVLQDYRREIVKRIGEYRDLEAYMLQGGCPIHPLAVSRRPIYLLEGELKWLDDFIRENMTSQ